jgi:crotonobetainyl-CoA:carnitine CoA-transferase CaiB-like acyl-CoA transferase
MALSDGIPVAQAGQFLADFGADVVQVEPPGGSALRHQPAWPFYGRGKRSLELDLGDPEDHAVARRLAAGSDVIIESFRPGVAARLGLDYEDLVVDNPGLIYASITGFGPDGPCADLQGYEGIVLAKLGALQALSDMTERPGPSFPSAPFSAYPATHLALQGILAALYERHTSGLGQRVSTSLAQGLTVHDTFNWFARVVASRFSDAFKQTPVAVQGVPSGGLSFRLLIALTADGKWLQFSQTVDRLFRAMMRMFGLAWMFDDPEWATAPDFDDVDRRVAFWERLLTVVRSAPVADWQSRFDADPDVWGEKFSRGNEALDHPQMLWNRMVAEADDPLLGPVVQPGPVVRIGDGTTRVHPAPERGEYDAALRAEAAAMNPVAGRDRPASAQGGAPLQGVTIIELGTYYAAPFGATLLADLGARVIKIEQLDGDPHRHMLPFPELAGTKVLQGKQSVAVDFTTEAGLSVAYDLISRADVVLQSFRAGAAERLKLDPSSLRALNPNLVYLCAPGYGTGGPCGHRPAFAPTIGAASGLAWRNAGSTIPERDDLTIDQIKPTAMRMALAVMGVGNSDGFAGVTVGTALLLGLVAAQRGAPNETMLTTMLSTSVHALGEDMVRYTGRSPLVMADPGLHGLGPLYRLYQAASGWVFLAAPTDRDWSKLAAALDLGGDARFVDRASRLRHSDDLIEVLSGVFATRPASDWETFLRAADVACVEVADGPVDANFLLDGSLGQQCGFVTETDHPVLDRVPRLAPLVRFSRSATVAGAACLCGQHTDEVLREIGYSDEKISALRLAGIIGG